MIFLRIPRVTLLAGLFVFMVTGCRRESGWMIGVSQCSSDDWREKMNEEILRESLFHDNVHVEILGLAGSTPAMGAQKIANSQIFRLLAFSVYSNCSQ